MRCVVNIDDDNAQVVALRTRDLLESVVRQNLWIMHKYGDRIPNLYDSGVRFRIEPWASQLQHFADYLEILERGWGDCKCLAAVVVAWRRRMAATPELARRYGFKIYWRVYDKDPLHDAVRAQTPGKKEFRIYHVQVRHPDGSIEDPSRMLHT